MSEEIDQVRERNTIATKLLDRLWNDLNNLLEHMPNGAGAATIASTAQAIMSVAALRARVIRPADDQPHSIAWVEPFERTPVKWPIREFLKGNPDIAAAVDALIVVTDTDREIARQAVEDGWNNCGYNQKNTPPGCDCKAGECCKARIASVARAIAAARKL